MLTSQNTNDTADDDDESGPDDTSPMAYFTQELVCPHQLDQQNNTAVFDWAETLRKETMTILSQYVPVSTPNELSDHPKLPPPNKFARPTCAVCCIDSRVREVHGYAPSRRNKRMQLKRLM
eukprot:1797732-Ditylum_brightwellii.AAC.1